MSKTCNVIVHLYIIHDYIQLISNYCMDAKCFIVLCISTFPVTGFQQWVQMFNSCIDVDDIGSVGWNKVRVKVLIW